MRDALILLAIACASSAGAETLQIFPPAGFAGVHVSDSAPLGLIEYVNDGGTLERWTDAITVAELRGSPLGAPAYVARLAADMDAVCAQAIHMDPDVFDAGGRVSTMSVHVCPNMDASGRSEVDLLRVIEGRDNTLFAIQRSWNGNPDSATLMEWSDWIRALRVCDDDGCS